MAKELFKIYDFSIKEDTLYEVREKIDHQAPDGYKKEGTSKMLVNGIKNIESGAVYNDLTNSWDTGLYLESAILSNAFPDDDVRASIVKKFKELIITPLEKVQGEGTLRHTKDNNEYWDNFRTEIYRGKVFNTKNPRELLELVYMIMKKKLTPSEHTSNPEFISSQYTIVDKESVQNRKAEQTEKRFEAVGKFEQFLSSNREVLVSIMAWMNLAVNSEMSNSSLRLMFNNFLEDKNNSYQNTDIFLDTVKMEATKAGKDKIYIYNKLKESSLKGKVKQVGKDLFLNEIFIGTSYKNATEAIVADKELKKLFSQVCEE